MNRIARVGIIFQFKDEDGLISGTHSVYQITHFIHDNDPDCGDPDIYGAAQAGVGSAMKATQLLYEGLLGLQYTTLLIKAYGGYP